MKNIKKVVLVGALTFGTMMGNIAIGSPVAHASVQNPVKSVTVKGDAGVYTINLVERGFDVLLDGQFVQFFESYEPPVEIIDYEFYQGQLYIAYSAYPQRGTGLIRTSITVNAPKDTVAPNAPTFEVIDEDTDIKTVHVEFSADTVRYNMESQSPQGSGGNVFEGNEAFDYTLVKGEAVQLIAYDKAGNASKQVEFSNPEDITVATTEPVTPVVPPVVTPPVVEPPVVSEPVVTPPVVTPAPLKTVWESVDSPYTVKAVVEDRGFGIYVDGKLVKHVDIYEPVVEILDGAYSNGRLDLEYSYVPQHTTALGRTTISISGVYPIVEEQSTVEPTPVEPTPVTPVEPTPVTPVEPSPVTPPVATPAPAPVTKAPVKKVVAPAKPVLKVVGVNKKTGVVTVKAVFSSNTASYKASNGVTTMKGKTNKTFTFTVKPGKKANIVAYSKEGKASTVAVYTNKNKKK